MHSAIIGLDIGIRGRLARPREIYLDLVLIRPQIHDLAGKLTPIGTEQFLRGAPVVRNLIEHRHDEAEQVILQKEKTAA